MPGGELSGKTAIVTGGGSGLGRAMALGLARAGAHVVITAARGRHEIEAVVDEAAKISQAASHTSIQLSIGTYFTLTRSLIQRKRGPSFFRNWFSRQMTMLTCGRISRISL
jgi:NAD(P)-dependent dehydrogenase (short-subunit alcohol dehydrogenase family)